jgi:hypothetical protein
MTPEVYFMDFGTAQLVNGYAHVNLDPILAGNVQIDATHPLRVFVQTEDAEDSAGVTVKNKSAHGFDVVERQGGQSNLIFQWQIVCNRADEMVDGRKSHNASVRFESHPDLDGSSTGTTLLRPEAQTQ